MLDSGQPTGSRHARRPSRERAEGGRDQSAERGTLSAKTRSNLSQVPCKFFRQSTCTAVDCPFLHDTGPARTKQLCTWYQKGNCKFGHKCALAHVMPGEPLANDRKNKRTQQLAQREAQQKDQGAGKDGASAPPEMNGDQAATAAVGPQLAPSASLQASEAGSSTVPPASTSLLTPNAQAPEFRPSMPRPMMLEQTNRRPSAGAYGGGSPSFGTSPFSPPGTGVFFSGSLGSDDGGLARRRRESPARGRTSYNGANGGTAIGSDSDEVELEDGSDDEAGYDALGYSQHEEDCLPSSLSDLMTPDEIQRRQRKMVAQLAAGVDNATLSRSVPHAPAMHSPTLSQSSVGSLYGAEPFRLASRLNGGPAAVSNSNYFGSSLPPGLAAGASRLHLQAAKHTGFTPPSSQGVSPVAPSGLGASSFSHTPPPSYGGPTGAQHNNLGIAHVKGSMVVGSPLARTAWSHASPRARTEEPRSPAPIKDAKESSAQFEGEEMPFELEY